MLLRDLTPSICADIAQLANPRGLSRLSEERLQEVRVSLNSTCKRLKAHLAQAPRTNSQDIMLMHEALQAATKVIELIHPPG